MFLFTNKLYCIKFLGVLIERKERLSTTDYKLETDA